MPSVQTIVYCVPASTTQAPCPAGMGLATTEAVLVEPSYLASVTELNAPFNYGLASAAFGFSFSFILGLYFVSKGSGYILEAIKKF